MNKKKPCKQVKSINDNKVGAPFKYEPEELAQKIKDYYKEIDNNPIEKKKVETSNKDTKETIEYIKRPYTIEGLCNYLDITCKTFRNWENNEQLLPLITRARQTIYDNKLEGATAGIFNSNIVALDLGMARKEQEQQAGLLIPIGTKEAKAILQSLSDEYGELPEPKTIDVESETVE